MTSMMPRTTDLIGFLASKGISLSSHNSAVPLLPVEVFLRPIGLDDSARYQAFLNGLSPGTRYFRFGNHSRLPTQAEIQALCRQDSNHVAHFIALVHQDGLDVQVDSAYYECMDDGDSCELVLLVADAWQRRRVAHRLLKRLVRNAEQGGLKRMFAQVLATNLPMQRFVRRHGFEEVAGSDHQGVKTWCLTIGS